MKISNSVFWNQKYSRCNPWNDTKNTFILICWQVYLSLQFPKLWRITLRVVCKDWWMNSESLFHIASSCTMELRWQCLRRQIVWWLLWFQKVSWLEVVFQHVVKLDLFAFYLPSFSQIFVCFVYKISADAMDVKILDISTKYNIFNILTFENLTEKIRETLFTL